MGDAVFFGDGDFAAGADLVGDFDFVDVDAVAAAGPAECVLL
jgi:hypothetical protein